MSEDEEYEDELPAISVDSSARESGGPGLVMPSARELAASRARELSVQLELRALRHAHEKVAGAGVAARSDSSGSSEGDAALAAAVGALRVLPAAPAAPPAAERRARAARLAAALAHRLPPAEAHALHEYARLLRREPPATQRARATFAERLVAGVCGALGGGGAWGARELLATGAALLALCAGGCVGALRARRALHRLLDAHAAPEQVWELARLASEAAGEAAGEVAGAARLRGALADAARSGGGAARGADLLAALLLRRALAELLQPGAEGGESAALDAAELSALLRGARGSGWAALAPRAQYACVALAGRALALAGGGAALAGALTAPAAARARHCPDQLRAQVAATRLQLLFRAPEAGVAATCSN